MLTDRIPIQINRHIKRFVHAGDLNDIERAVLAVENLLSRNKKFVLEFDGINVSKIEFDPPERESRQKIVPWIVRYDFLSI